MVGRMVEAEQCQIAEARRRSIATVAGSLLSLIALLTQASPAQSQETPEAMMIMSGHCDKLMVGAKDMTRFCEGKIVSTSYASGRVGFYFVLQNGAIVTLSGNDLPNPAPDTDRFYIDRMIVNLGDGTKPAQEPAIGSCDYSNPYAGKPAFVRCIGKDSSDNPIRASFTTDGRPPENAMN